MHDLAEMKTLSEYGRYVRLVAMGTVLLAESDARLKVPSVKMAPNDTCRCSHLVHDVLPRSPGHPTADPS